MNYGMGSGRTGFTSFEKSARKVLQNTTMNQRRFTGASNALGYVPDMGLGGNFFTDAWKSIGKATTAITRVATYPIRVIGAVSLQTVGLKTLASKVGGPMISKNLLKSVGQAGQIAGAVVVGAAIAPAVIGAVGTAASAVGGVVGTGVTTLVGGAGNLVKSVGNVLGTAKDVGAAVGAAKDLTNPASNASAQNQQAPVAQQTFDAQPWYDAGVADARGNRSKAAQTDPEGNKWYSQGYDDALAELQAQRAEATVNQTAANQAVRGNDLTGTSRQDTIAAQEANKALADVKAFTASMVSPENLKKIATIAVPLLMLGFMFSNKNPAVQIARERKRR